MARRMAQNGAPTHEFECQGRWKQGGGMVGRYHPRRICWLGAAVPKESRSNPFVTVQESRGNEQLTAGGERI